jgi:NADP-dependent 3-hydroxy acid dehydrogenase YdfG
MSQHPPVVIISGAASGMDCATARLLADSRYTVEGCDAAVTASVAQVDVRDNAASQRWVDSVRAGRADTAISAVPA